MVLVTELRRRNVFRVAAAYLVVGWLLLFGVGEVAIGVTRDCLIGVAVPKPGVTSNTPRPVRKAVRPVQHDH